MIGVLVGVVLGLARGQEPSLAAYLNQHPWDVAKRGPMVVVYPDRTHVVNTSGGLAGYDRKEFNVGTLTAIAPYDMVMIDTSLEDPPNFYDGLPRKDKVLYLMSLLDPDQWKLACSTGIGLSDLRNEQRAVYRSILPSTFNFQNMVVGKGNGLLPKPGEPAVVTLTADEESEVKLHLQKILDLGVKMTDGGFSAVSPELSDSNREGKPFLYRADTAAEDRTSLFGVQIRKVLDNRLKPSDLSYKLHALDSPVALTKKTTVAELCSAVGTACGLNVVADSRVADLPVVAYGDSVRSGDVLQALALAVTGTFRKVGETFLLTSDLEGIGAKRLKIETWKQDLQLLLRQRTDGWKRSIAEGGAAHLIGFPSDSPLPISDLMTQFMDHEYENDGSKTIPASQLPPQWQKILNEGTSRFAAGTMRTDVAFPYGELFWNFVLPDGRPLEREESLGYSSSLTKAPGPPRERFSRTEIRPLELKAGTSAALMLKTDEPSVASELPALARGHGFEEVWLQTWEPACLQNALTAAQALGIRVRLVLKPWEIPSGFRTSDPDRNILGDTSTLAENRVEETAVWNDSSEAWGVTHSAAGTFIGPGDPMLPSLWRKLLDLSKTQGLDGVVLCGTEPRGYEPKMGSPLFGTPLLDLGYSQSLRSRFLQENQVDPVDIVDRRLMNYDSLDLSLPFFGDPMTTSLDLPAGTIEKWAKLRADANREAVQNLMSQLTGSILVQPRQLAQDIITLNGVQVLPSSIAKVLPENPPDLSFEAEERGVPANGYCLWSFGHPTDPLPASRMYESLVRHLKEAKGKIAIDFSSVPIDEFQKVLDKWFMKS
jgi:hypothetical protein